MSPFARDPVRLAPGKFGYRGVRCYPDGRRRRFYARVKLHGEAHFTPGFAMPHEAAIAYDELALRLHGEKAILNFGRSRPSELMTDHALTSHSRSITGE